MYFFFFTVHCQTDDQAKLSTCTPPDWHLFQEVLRWVPACFWLRQLGVCGGYSDGRGLIQCWVKKSVIWPSNSIVTVHVNVWRRFTLRRKRVEGNALVRVGCMLAVTSSTAHVVLALISAVGMGVGGLWTFLSSTHSLSTRLSECYGRACW